MPITVYCPKCSKKINAPDHAAGKRGKCPFCNEFMMVPAQSQPEPQPALLEPVATAPATVPTEATPLPRGQIGTAKGVAIILGSLALIVIYLTSRGGGPMTPPATVSTPAPEVSKPTTKPKPETPRPASHDLPTLVSKFANTMLNSPESAAIKATILENRQAALVAFKTMLKNPAQRDDAVLALGIIEHNFQDSEIEGTLIELVRNEEYPKRRTAILTLGDQYVDPMKARDALHPLIDLEFKVGPKITTKPALTVYKQIREGKFFKFSVRELAVAINNTIRNGGASNTDSQYASVRLEAAWGECFSEILQGQPNVALLILKNSGALDDLKGGQLKDALDALVCKIEYTGGGFLD